METERNMGHEIIKTCQLLKEHVVEDIWRLAFHLMPETGWLNDPNGAVQYKGVYHIYYQYVSDSATGGLKHWGHKTSTDLVTFTDEPIFLSPTEWFDRDGVYSGSALVHKGELHFFYTGNVKQAGDYDYTYNGRSQHTIHVTSCDGYTVLRREVVIPHGKYPDDCTNHVRDPKVFERNGVFYLLLGVRKRSNIGAVLVYQSKDLTQWRYSGEFITGQEMDGYMWECPDYMMLDDYEVLLVSPQGILPTQYEHHNPYSVCYMLGTVDWDTVTFNPSSSLRLLDYGFDMYAPQTFVDEKGRRIMWAWMGIGDTEPEYTNPTVSRGWQHALTLPRELRIVDGKLIQLPLEEYESLRYDHVSHELMVDGLCRIPHLGGEVYELSIQCMEGTEAFELYLREDTSIKYIEQVLTLQHGTSGYGRRKRSLPLSVLRSLRIFSDYSSLEIFVNDGEYVLTSRVYPKSGEDGIAFGGKATIHIDKWALHTTTDR